MVIYRRLFAAEAPLYREHLLRLDAESRYARFSAFQSDSSIRSYCANIDWRSTTLIGAFAEGTLRGAAEICYERRPFPTSAELAFSVERGHQSSRIGTRLIWRALHILANRRVHHAQIVCLLGNHRMQRLALKHRALVKASRGEVFMTLAVPPASPTSLMIEWADGYFGWLISCLNTACRLIPPSPVPAWTRSPGGA